MSHRHDKAGEKWGGQPFQCEGLLLESALVESSETGMVGTWPPPSAPAGFAHALATRNRRRPWFISPPFAWFPASPPASALFAGKPISTNQICCFRLMWLYSGMNKVKALKQIRQRETSNRDTHSLFCLKDEPKWMN
ncbi:MAG: hypothetical protein K0M58_08770 [Thiobacillus sp.]|nr:hypothetical protein [Thiobacillus sp.]